MTQVSLSTFDLLLVDEIPEDTECTVLEDVLLLIEPYSMTRRKLPPGSWSILGSGKSGDCTAANWISVLEKENDGSDHLRSWWYRDFFTGGWVKDPVESGLSLLTLHGFDPARTVILVKQK